MSVNDKLQSLLIESRFQRDRESTSVLGGIDFYRPQMADFVLYTLLGTRVYQEKAVSYRGFNVAAGVLAVKASGYARFYGNNIKVDDTDTVNIHAEDIAVGKAERANYDAISVLTVIGPTQEDHASGLHTHTLHPCGRCRDRLSTHPLISDDTLIVTATPNFKTLELFNFPALERLHAKDIDEDIIRVELHDSDQLFKPLNDIENGYEARGNRVEEVDDSEWQEKVVLPLMIRQHMKRKQLKTD